MRKSEISLKVFVVFVFLLFAFLILDLSLSYVSVCKSIGDELHCELVPVIQTLPTF